MKKVDLGKCDAMEGISIIVPVYNAEKYIRKCIQSIQKQTYQNWDLILVDDGSTDHSGSICDVFAQKDKRITVIHQENRGSVEARKAGVLSKVAQKNPWIMMSDADDTMPPDAIDKLYNAAQKYQAEMVVGAVTKMFKGISIPSRWKSPCFQIDKPQLYSHDEIIDKLFISYFGITNFPVSLFAKLYRTEPNYIGRSQTISDGATVKSHRFCTCRKIYGGRFQCYHSAYAGGKKSGDSSGCCV